MAAVPRKVVVQFWESGESEDAPDKKIPGVGGWTLPYSEEMTVGKLQERIELSFPRYSRGYSELHIKYLKDAPSAGYEGGVLDNEEYARNIFDPKDTVRVYLHERPRPPPSVGATRYGSVMPGAAATALKRSYHSSQGWSPLQVDTKRRKISGHAPVSSLEGDEDGHIQEVQVDEQSQVIHDSQRSPQQPHSYATPESYSAHVPTLATTSKRLNSSRSSLTNNSDVFHNVHSVPASNGASPTANEQPTTLFAKPGIPASRPLSHVEVPSPSIEPTSGSRYKTPEKANQGKSPATDIRNNRIANVKSLSGQRSKPFRNIYDGPFDEEIVESSQTANRPLVPRKNGSNRRSGTGGSSRSSSRAGGRSRAVHTTQTSVPSNVENVGDDGEPTLPPPKAIQQENRAANGQCGVPDPTEEDVEEPQEDETLPDKKLQQQPTEIRPDEDMEHTNDAASTSNAEVNGKRDSIAINGTQDVTTAGTEAKMPEAHQQLSDSIRKDREQYGGTTPEPPPFSTAPIPGTSSRRSVSKPRSLSRGSSSKGNQQDTVKAQRSVSFAEEEHPKRMSSTLSSSTSKPELTKAVKSTPSKVTPKSKPSPAPNNLRNALFAKYSTKKVPEIFQSTSTTKTRTSSKSATPDIVPAASTKSKTPSKPIGGRSSSVTATKSKPVESESAEEESEGDDSGSSEEESEEESEEGSEEEPEEVPENETAHKKTQSIGSDNEDGSEEGSEDETASVVATARESSIVLGSVKQAQAAGNKTLENSDSLRQASEHQTSAPTNNDGDAQEVDDSSEEKSDSDEDAQDEDLDKIPDGGESGVHETNSVTSSAFNGPESRSPAREVQTSSEDSEDSGSESEAEEQDLPMSGQGNADTDPKGDANVPSASSSSESDESSESDQDVALPKIPSAKHSRASLNERDDAERQLQQEATQSITQDTSQTDGRAQSSIEQPPTPRSMDSLEKTKASLRPNISTSKFPSFSQLKNEPLKDPAYQSSATQKKSTSKTAKGYISSESESESESSEDDSADEVKKVPAKSENPPPSAKSKSKGKYMSLMKFANKARP